MVTPNVVRVGNAGGYWGDDLEALPLQLSQGPLDYVTLDFLAELTLSILQKQRARNPKSGYAADFVEQMRTSLPLLHEKKVRIISNAGGLNPRGCAEEIARLARQMGIQTRIAVVEGDDLVGRLDELRKRGISLANLETNQDFATIRGRVESANAYVGAAPVIKALEQGAEIVVTGRLSDAALSVAPPAFEFGWSLEDWGRLALAVVAGHILECGAQATGGNYTDWQQVSSFLKMGYPIVEFFEDGSFWVTRHEGTAGLVNRHTVASQLVYEINDPKAYFTPDVIADFSGVTLEDEGNQRVKVSGAKGRPRPSHLKVSVSYFAGYKSHGMMVIGGPKAVEKSRLVADVFWRRLNLEFEETSTELVGYNACHQHLARGGEPPEILLRLGVRDPEPGKIERFGIKFTSLILNTVPGIAIVGARPRVQEVVAYWPCLVPASEVTPQVILLDTAQTFHIPWNPPREDPPLQVQPSLPPETEKYVPPTGPMSKVPLIRLCCARSGDKGDTCNIGVIARSRKIYPWLRHHLSAEKVKDYFGEMVRGKVERFELPNLLAFNFVLRQSLGGGGTVSLRIDPQGKTLAEALLMMEVEVPHELVPSKQ